jgi:hypothetical protein
MLAPDMGERRHKWSIRPANTLATASAFLAVGALLAVALLSDAPQHGRTERLAATWASCGDVGLPPCDTVSVGHLRKVRPAAGAGEARGLRAHSICGLCRATPRRAAPRDSSATRPA